MTNTTKRSAQFSSTVSDTEPVSDSPTPCHLLMADVLGFTRTIKSLPNDSQSSRVNDWVTLVEETRRKTDIRELQLVSDTLFVREEDSVAGLKRLLEFSRLLLGEGIKQFFPIRGAIVHGDVRWGDPTYGRAVVEAFELERSLEWIGISSSLDGPKLESLWSWDLLVRYPVPQKSGEVDFAATVAWDVPKTPELALNIYSDETFADDDLVEWDVYSKIEQTLQFGMYLRCGKAMSLDPSKFRGAFFIELIERYLEPHLRHIGR